ncbi:MAG: hypothetical protein RMY62_014730 [Nostoc sp. ZfuVER08]|nr:hypothetical protein [Nostoc sp. ZfuVER08]
MDNNYRPWAVCRLGQVVTRYHHRAEAEMEVQRLNRLVMTGFFYVENQSLEISKKENSVSQNPSPLLDVVSSTRTVSSRRLEY